MDARSLFFRGRRRAPRRRPELPLEGFPPNLAHETAFYGAAIPELAQKNLSALVLATTGEELDDLEQTLTDLGDVAGHRHDTRRGLLRWQGVGGWTAPADLDDGGREGYLVTDTSLTDVAVIPVRAPLRNDYGVAASSFDFGIIPFFRVSNPAPGYATYTTLTLKGVFKRITNGSAALGAQVGDAFEVSIPAKDAASALSRAWVRGPRLDLAKSAGADAVNDAAANLALTLSARVTTAGDKATLWEVYLGLPRREAY
jgi:hypothetical protein